MLAWYQEALGPKYGILIPLSALVTYALTILLLIRGKGPALGAALILLASLPAMIGLFALVEGLSLGYHRIAESGFQPHYPRWMAGYSQLLAKPQLGVLLSAPVFLLAIVKGFTDISSDRSTTKSVDSNIAKITRK